jgi:hypothetical protein
MEMYRQSGIEAAIRRANLRDASGDLRLLLYI